MKILLLGDASNYHSTLATGLARAGHDVTVASAGSGWMNTARDIDISRRPGRLGGALLWLKLNTVLSGKLKGYDVVQLYNPVFVHQRPQRVRTLFDRLRRDNGSVFLSHLSTDSPYVDMCFAKDNPLRYSEFMASGVPTPYTISHQQIVAEWMSGPLHDLCSYIYEHIDGAVSALYEYHLACLRALPQEKVAYGGIPIDMSRIAYSGIPSDGKLRIMVACHKGREAEKGVDRMLPVVSRLALEYPDRLELDLVQNVPIEEFRKRLDATHIVVDQLYSYTPATTALMAMAGGKIVVSGAEKEYYDFIGEKALHPIINADPDDPDALYDTLRALLFDRERVRCLSEEGRAFVSRHNDADTVARRFIDFWTKTMNIE
ncbi:MAG: glycosyltransferase family 1 protein [Muribaculaceae bacterium]|nr:glycosyltransferase family 1 protein [Muribaculaceae bacterium]